MLLDAISWLAQALVTVVLVLVTFWTPRSDRITKSMEGKTVILTCGTEDIVNNDKETVLEFMRRGARVILACRNLEKGAKVAGELRVKAGGAGQVVVRLLNTSDFASVRAFAKEVLDSEKAIHVLINNAYIEPPEERLVTADGLELTMATNHFGQFLLTNLLLGRLKESAPSRIVTMSSFLHILAEFDENDLTFSKSYDQVQPFFVSMLCNILFTRELGDRLRGTGVTANSLNPLVNTAELLDSPNSQNLSFSSTISYIISMKMSKSTAQCIIHMAESEEVADLTGRYFTNCKEKVPSELARRKDLATRMWNTSVKAVKLQQHETHC